MKYEITIERLGDDYTRDKLVEATFVLPAPANGNEGMVESAMSIAASDTLAYFAQSAAKVTAHLGRAERTDVMERLGIILERVHQEHVAELDAAAGQAEVRGNQDEGGIPVLDTDR